MRFLYILDKYECVLYQICIKNKLYLYMHGDNIKNVRNFYMYLNNGADGYIVYRKSGRVTYYSAWSTTKNVVIKK